MLQLCNDTGKHPNDLLTLMQVCDRTMNKIKIKNKNRSKELLFTRAMKKIFPMTQFPDI